MSSPGITYRYFFVYTAAFLAILLAFYAVPSGWAESITAQSASWALALFGHNVSWGVRNGYTYLNLDGVYSLTVTIIRECTALNVLGVMAGLIIPLRASWRRRLSGAALSGVLLFIFNIPRIALTVYLTSYPTYPFTLLSGTGLETYHYSISFAFGVIGVASTVLIVSRFTTPELADTLLGIVDKIAIVFRLKRDRKQ